MSTAPIAEAPPATVDDTRPYAKTQIFAYRGVVGILGGTATVNDPSAPGQMGVIVDSSEVAITQPALDVLLKVKKSRDAIGDVMCWKVNDGRVCFGWMGGRKYALNADFAEADRDYDPELLRPNIVPEAEIEIPADFAAMVDANLPPDTSPPVEG